MLFLGLDLLYLRMAWLIYHLVVRPGRAAYPVMSEPVEERCHASAPPRIGVDTNLPHDTVVPWWGNRTIRHEIS